MKASCSKYQEILLFTKCVCILSKPARLAEISFEFAEISDRQDDKFTFKHTQAGLQNVYALKQFRI